MFSQQAYELSKPAEQRSYDAEIIPFPIRSSVGKLAVRAFARNKQKDNPIESELANEAIAVHQGSGSTRYLSRRAPSLSVAPHSTEYNMRAKELLNR